MKMAASELDSFIFKFKQLWHLGLDAHLNIDTHAGQAWVGLRVGLGHAPGPLLHHQLHEHFPQNTRKDSPSRQRRRARRAASRKQQAEKAQVDEAKEANSNDLVKFQEMCSISLYTIFLMIKLQSENLDVENVEVLNQHSDDVQDGPIKPIDDEFCPDEDYHEVDNVGKTAFICHQCRMSFLPKNYKEGNTIETFESCRRHIGVLKCEHCASVLVGLTRIRCHRQVCHPSA